MLGAAVRTASAPLAPLPLALLLIAALLACEPSLQPLPSPTPDGGRDAGSASERDGGGGDAGLHDGGVEDAGLADAGGGDGGERDGGTGDGGEGDGGVIDAGTWEVAAVVANLPSAAVGGFALYSRNSPRFVRAGTVDYLGLNVSGAIRIYRRLAGQPWALYDSVPVNFHRPPTLLVARATLHVLWETLEGFIRHRAYAQANTATPGGAQDLSNDTAWGQSNYYIGGSASAVDDALYLCVAVGVTGNEHARCGTYRAGAWTVQPVQSFTDHQYLYPNMEPAADGGVWLDLGAYPLNRGGSPYPTYVRTLNVVFRLSPSLAVVPGGSSYGSAAAGRAYFTNDIATFPGNSVLLLPTRTSSELSGAAPPDSNVVALSSATSFAQPSPTGLAGSAYTMQVVGARVVAVGAGQVASSTDGVSWSSRAQALPGYPTSAWAYGVAQTLQARGGSPTAARLTFVQELTDRATGAITIVSAQAPLGAF